MSLNSIIIRNIEFKNHCFIDKNRMLFDDENDASKKIQSKKNCVTSRSQEEEEGKELITNFSRDRECVLTLISRDRTLGPLEKLIFNREMIEIAIWLDRLGRYI